MMSHQTKRGTGDFISTPDKLSFPFLFLLYIGEKDIILISELLVSVKTK